MEEIRIGYWFSKQHEILPDPHYRLKVEVANDLKVPFYVVQYAAKIVRRLGLGVNYPSLLASVYFIARNEYDLKYSAILRLLRKKRSKGKKIFKRTLTFLRLYYNYF